ncbi:heavy-metal-associated domain-containing protein [Deinococcus sp. Marseille-Q6407]|uniref:heavy-metal-associated domain-containing protein n=1 Tax=Deinococcus sp. Marseille-Q6407 TaxID=2969223 RepID=UPI0021BE085B|nr:heavy-metal-associated domain-containing protein [Deinococcus sp. Marseille-Q6407]
MTNPTRVLLGVRGMDREAGERVAAHLLSLPGISKAAPDTGQIEVHYDPSLYTVMDLVRQVRSQGFLAGML